LLLFGALVVTTAFFSPASSGSQDKTIICYSVLKTSENPENIDYEQTNKPLSLLTEAPTSIVGEANYLKGLMWNSVLVGVEKSKTIFLLTLPFQSEQSKIISRI